MAMKRVIVDGKVLNKRTADMLKRAEQRLGRNLYVVQGSYNAGQVQQSAGTHDGGGAIDLSVDGLSLDTIKEIVRQLRKVGFAAWYRAELWRNGVRVWGPHIHAIAVGDPELSSGAADQVREYYAGYDGLAGDGKDDGPRFDPIPVWPVKLGKLPFARVSWQFRTKTPKAGVPAVKAVQRLLNYRLGLNLVVDGQAGRKTREAWKKWESKVGNKAPDTVPGLNNLKSLVSGYYKVTVLRENKK